MTGNKIIYVSCHGNAVGKLAQMPDKRVAFQYDSEWIKKGFSISPLSLPLSEKVFVPGERSLDRFGGLFGVFADSLPDNWGRLLLDRYLLSLGIKKEDISILDRLAYIGRSGMGALEYAPAYESDFDLPVAGLDYDDVAIECEKLLSSQASDKLEMLYKMGGSSGGTRPKVMLKENDKEWIIKFPSGNDPAVSGKREYDYSICAKKCGIEMTETALIPSSVCEGYFKTERFDRINNEKIFAVSFAGLLEADYRLPFCDYEAFFKLVRVLTKDNAKDKEQLFKIMCFNVIAHNRDDHTKNFSFIYTSDEGWHLSPAYDLTYSDTYWGEHTTTVNGKGQNITKDDLVKVGIEAGIDKKKCEMLYEDIKSNTKDLEDYLSAKPRGIIKKISFSERIAELMEKKCIKTF